MPAFGTLREYLADLMNAEVVLGRTNEAGPTCSAASMSPLIAEIEQESGTGFLRMPAAQVSDGGSSPSPSAEA